MKMTDEVEAVMGGVRMGVNVDIKRTDGESQLLILWAVVMMVSCNQSEYLMFNVDEDDRSSKYFQ